MLNFRIFKILGDIYLFQAAVPALLAVSVLCIEKNQNRLLHNISKIRHISNNFSYDMPATLLMKKDSLVTFFF